MSRQKEDKKKEFHFKIDETLSKKFKKNIKDKGYETKTEWFREKIREELND